MSSEKFMLLRDRKIIAILDGDSDFGHYNPLDGSSEIRISMPYLSGPEICDISRTFGLALDYRKGGVTQSRWNYLDDLLLYCIKNEKISQLLGYLFSKGQFVESLKGHTAEAIDQAYDKIVGIAIGQINGILSFGGHELIVAGTQFFIRELDSTIAVETPILKTIDREYIRDLSERAMGDVYGGNFDSAVSKSRTILEEVFCYVIEKSGATPSDSGDIGKLYKQVKDIFNMHADRDADKRINTLLSGLEKIVSSIAEMRNEAGDSHGVGSRRINISEHHARLYVNAAMTMADFILSVSARRF